MKVEYINVEFSIDENSTENPGTLPDASLINVRLVSPHGTESTLISAPDGLDENAEFYHTRLGSNAFLDESSEGDWYLFVEEVDTLAAPFKDPKDIRSFSIKDIKLEIYGREL